MGTCLLFGDRSTARERLAAHLGDVFGALRCVETVPELMADLAEELPDVLLVEADGGSAWLEAVRQTRRGHPGVPVLVVAGPDSVGRASGEERAALALRMGARGYLGAADLAEPGARPAARPETTELSGREMDVLMGMTEGLSNAEIAADLVLAEDTVKTHARRLFRKLGAGDRADAVARGFRQGILR
jgi:two-component system, NarL family, nitrate/nitrite response regulator NarL